MTANRGEKRDKYIEGRRSGMRPTDAGRFAGYSNPRSQSSRLENHDHVVIAAVKQIQEDTVNQGNYTREQAVLDLKEAVSIAKNARDPQGIARCVNELNRMHGYLAPDKKEIDIDVHGMDRKTHLENLSDSELLKMIGGEEGLITDVEWEEVKDDDEEEDD